MEACGDGCSISKIMLVRIGVGGRLGWHIDRDHGDPDDYRVATMSVMLTPADLGGILELEDHGLVHQRAGDAVIFSSSTRHRVTPVLSGERTTLVTFIENRA